MEKNDASNCCKLSCLSSEQRGLCLWHSRYRPAWFMKTLHVLIKCIGVKHIELGSTGHGGRDAADKVVEYLKAGYSTHINPDGPRGPVHKVKKGVLHMAQKSGKPIIPLRIETPTCWTIKNTWDQKRIPLPFSKIRVIYGKPIFVQEVNEASERLHGNGDVESASPNKKRLREAENAIEMCHVNSVCDAKGT